MTAVVVYATRDDEREAREIAETLVDKGRRAAVMTVLDWNRAHPERLVRTANRFLVYAEAQDA